MRFELEGGELVGFRGDGNAHVWSLSTGERALRPATEREEADGALAPPTSDGRPALLRTGRPPRYLMATGSHVAWSGGRKDAAPRSPDLGSPPVGAVMSEDGRHVVVSTRGHLHRVLSTADLSLEATLVIGHRGYAVILPDGSYEQRVKLQLRRCATTARRPVRSRPALATASRRSTCCVCFFPATDPR